jgi:ssDNA-binding replication factor A large subunit
VTQSAIAYLDRVELIEAAVQADPIARSTLIQEDWKDKEAVARYLNPARYQIAVEVAVEEIEFRSARLFVQLQERGKLPSWILQVVDYEKILMVAENG